MKYEKYHVKQFRKIFQIYKLGILKMHALPLKKVTYFKVNKVYYIKNVSPKKYKISIYQTDINFLGSHILEKLKHTQ